MTHTYNLYLVSEHDFINIRKGLMQNCHTVYVNEIKQFISNEKVQNKWKTSSQKFIWGSNNLIWIILGWLKQTNKQTIVKIILSLWVV